MLTRSEALSQARENLFDVVVIGGGIVGAGVAQEAASRGLSVALVEKDDYSSGTSSKTTKLIHGGLRYLEQFQFRLTRELCHERQRLEQLAPHLVRDFSFVLPLVDESRIFGWKARAGLTLYDLLAGQLAGGRKHESLSRQMVMEAAPGLDARRINGGLEFHDCISDDSRMVLAVLKAACHDGAVPVNYMKATGFEMQEGRIESVSCRDRYSGQDVTIRCRGCVNASGVWSDELAALVDESWRRMVVPARGTHIMVPLSSFDTSTALFLPTPDDRYVFVVPWQKALMIGTTDTRHKAGLDSSIPTAGEVTYLIEAVNRYAGSRRLTSDDVIAAWAGLRPLVGRFDRSMIAEGGGSEEGNSTSELSREHYLFEGPANMIGLIGGKLTNYRILAGHVIDKVLESQPSLQGKAGPSKTGQTMLGGWVSPEGYLAGSAQISARARKLGVEPASIEHLIASYGMDAESILDLIEKDPLLNKRIVSDFPPLMAEVMYVVKEEMAVSLSDVLFRRVRLGLVHHEQCLKAARKVARLIQTVVGWDDQRTSAEIDAFSQTIEEHTVWDADLTDRSKQHEGAV